MEKIDGILRIDTAKKITEISPTLYGLFFEDINNGCDGGLYAELIKNGSFEYPDNLDSWSEYKLEGASGTALISDEKPINEINRNYIALFNTGDKEYGIINSGYSGITVSKGCGYKVSFYARSGKGIKVYAAVINENNERALETAVDVNGEEWKKYTVAVTAESDSAKGKFAVYTSEKGCVFIDFISMFPVETFKQRENGLRKDIAQTLADIKPSFFRFPGGCIVEGSSMSNAYIWKDTVGDITKRHWNNNLWGYIQSYGAGFHEYFQYCGDMGSEPVPILNVGMACQARKGVHAPMEELDKYIQDALDLIEYANGSTATKWGAERAANGHPEPFNLKYLGIGNEQWGEDYFPRYDKFYDVLKSKHPEIKYIFASGPFASGFMYNDAWDWARKTGKADIIDEHYYMAPDWFLQNVNRYDNYDRFGPKVFAGEYAAHNSKRRNNLEAALAEAAYLTGLERNSDVVVMAAYAPLLAKRGENQWAPNLVWFDNEKVVGTPSYYIQKMFSNYKGKSVVHSTLDVPVKEKRDSFIKGGVGIGSIDTAVLYKDLKVVSDDGTILFEDSLTAENEKLTKISGEWKAGENGTGQINLEGKHFAVTGEENWTSYTVNVKAKKAGGEEGFLLLAGVKDKENYYAWNLGGWKNTHTAVQRTSALVGYEITTMDKVKIENDVWYDLTLKVEGKTITCWLNGEQVHHVYDEVDYEDLYQTVSVEGDKIIIKTVNISDTDYNVKLDLGACGEISGTGMEIVLTGSKADENTFEEPHKITPVSRPLENTGREFVYNFKAGSAVILVLKKL